MENKQILLTQYVSDKFSNIKRKFTLNPYLDHLKSVASKSDSFELIAGYEIGLLHDLYEDTDTQPDECIEALCNMGYNKYHALYISNSVLELTNPYTRKNKPLLSSSKRDKLLLNFLENISPNSQSVKYCDIIDNCTNVVQADYQFAKFYLPKKSKQLDVMTKGNLHLKKFAKETIENQTSLLKKQII
tara:strand:- start:5333 stop:5896 length:564 start_codon:yes stop_codon:yes gene_type:complete